MLFEFDADQRLWQQTVRDVVAKECPVSLVRGVVDDDVDPAPLWRVYNDLGWTELTAAEEAVELAIVLEELGRAMDPTPYLATTTQFDHFVVNGQKVWTSGAHDADVLLTFVRTDPDAPKHRGFSVLLVPTDLPGVTRRPFGSLTSGDDLDFNEVFFSDVRVPKENLVGPLNGGWKVANGSLGHERNLLWLGFAERLEQLVDDVRPVGTLDRDRYATLVMDAEALRLLGSASLARAVRGEEDVAALSVLKLLGSEAVQKATEAALESAGPDALAHPATTAPYNHLHLENFSLGWFDRYARSFAGTIAGGTSEIQRTIIAERVLGLPRS